MTPAIQEATAVLKAAKENMRAVALAEQQKCAHSRIAQIPWKNSEYFSPSKARRICIDCGLEQECKSMWSDDADYNYSKLKSNGFHKRVDRDEFFSYRIPCTDVDTP